jgi:hypothetical protein
LKHANAVELAELQIEEDESWSSPRPDLDRFFSFSRPEELPAPAVSDDRNDVLDVVVVLDEKDALSHVPDPSGQRAPTPT